jgi:hypothetical protein
MITSRAAVTLPQDLTHLQTFAKNFFSEANEIRDSILDRFRSEGNWARKGCEEEDYQIRRSTLAPILLVLWTERLVGQTTILSERVRARKECVLGKSACFLLARRTAGELAALKKSDITHVSPPDSYRTPTGLTTVKERGEGGTTRARDKRARGTRETRKKAERTPTRAAKASRVANPSWRAGGTSQNSRRTECA